MRMVLVTGADGFVGRAVCARLLERGHAVVAGLRSSERWPSLRSAVPDLTSFRVLGDLNSATDIACSLDGIDAIVHLAGRVHIMQESAADPINEFRTANVLGTKKLALAAHESKVRRFIFVSTAKVHGETTGNRAFCESDAEEPKDAYALSKFEAENELRHISSQSGLEIVIVRPALVYGPGVRANFLRLIRLANLPLPLPIPETGNCRSLVGVRNLADFLVHCVCHDSAAGETFLVSDGQDFSTRELTRSLGQALGRRVRFLPVPAALARILGSFFRKPGEISRLLDSLAIDSGKARRMLNWIPPVRVEEELERTARWYREQYTGNPRFANGLK